MCTRIRNCIVGTRAVYLQRLCLLYFPQRLTKKQSQHYVRAVTWSFLDSSIPTRKYICMKGKIFAHHTLKNLNLVNCHCPIQERHRPFNKMATGMSMSDQSGWRGIVGTKTLKTQVRHHSNLTAEVFIKKKKSMAVRPW